MTPTLEISRPTPVALPDVVALSHDPRVQQAHARVVALQERLQAVEQQIADRHRVDPVADHVKRLLADPHAVLSPAPDLTKSLEAEAKALPRAIAAAETDAKRIRDEVSVAHSKGMRPAKVAAARELMTLLTRTAEILKADRQLGARLNAAGYTQWEAVLPALGYPDDFDKVDRLVQRVRASGLLED